MCSKFIFNYIWNIINYEWQIMSKTFLCEFMPCSEGMPFIFYSGVVCMYVILVELVSSLVDKRASCRVNIYSKIVIVVT